MKLGDIIVHVLEGRTEAGKKVLFSNTGNDLLVVAYANEVTRQLCYVRVGLKESKSVFIPLGRWQLGILKRPLRPEENIRLFNEQWQLPPDALVASEMLELG